MKHSTPLILACLLSGLAAPLAAAASDAPTSAVITVQDPVEDPEEKPKHLTEWPEADKELAKQIASDLGRLRKAQTEGMEQGGRDGLLAAGDAAGPELLKAIAKERDDAARARVAEVLTAVTDWRHTRLFAAEFDNKSEHVRLYALQRAAAFPDKGIRAAAEEAFAQAQKRAGTKKEIKDELYSASLALASSGSLDSLEALQARALEEWGSSGHAIRAAIEGLRGPEATAIVAKGLTSDDRKTKVAALRMLAGCGDKESAKALVAPSLDDTDNSIRVAAINALRGIVDGDPPMDRMSVFEAFELASKWKARL
jgi:hypothetical protein